MWIDRKLKKLNFISSLTSLSQQVLILQGARQVGKTSFVLNAFNDLKEYPQLRLNFLYPSSFKLGGFEYLGRDFFGSSPGGESFLANVEREIKNNKTAWPLLIFMDEVDHHPVVMEAIQALAQFSDKFKCVLTGSNLENITIKNAATGRKKYFDLYPITFEEFLRASPDGKILDYFLEAGPQSKSFSLFYHEKLKQLFKIYLRIGGLPRIVSVYLDGDENEIPQIIKDLAVSIEENIKTILGEKAKLYEYEDVLRKLAFFSLNTLKYTPLQVQHAGRQEAKRLVAKTVGARVAHKIRLFEDDKDLSKYILFDCGIVNYLLNGSDLLKNQIGEKQSAILNETFVGCELVSRLVSRDDLCYWKSGIRAELEFLLRSPRLVGIDVKTNKGDNKSLNSFATMEAGASCLVKISDCEPSFNQNHQAKLPNNDDKQTKIPLMTLPHYLTSRIFEILEGVL